MKFFEFNKYEYYALIVAEDEENAKKGYEEVVAEINEDEKSLSPDVISSGEALNRFVMGNIEGCTTKKEKVDDFNQNVHKFGEDLKNGVDKYLILLMDGSLI